MARVTFKLHCATVFGENLRLHLVGKVYAMSYANFETWQTILPTENLPESAEFYFTKVDEQGVLLSASLIKRFFVKAENDAIYYDEFALGNRHFQTLPFTECYFPAKNKTFFAERKINVFIPFVKKNQQPFLVGSDEKLGAWNLENALKLENSSPNFWSAKVPENLGFSEFKFVIFDKKTSQIIWETGENRQQNFAELGENFTLNFYFRGEFNFSASGVAVPIFSLKSEESCGVGEFFDLMKLGEFAAETGLNLIQILPINDTTFFGTNADSYPYRANSIFALHPIYIRLQAVGEIKKRSFEEKRKRLNALQNVDYEAVFRFKMEVLKELFLQEKTAVFSSEEYKTFFAQNLAWLVPYAVFSVLRDEEKTAAFLSWKRLATFNSREVQAYADENPQTVGFYYFAQFHADKQLKAVVKHLHALGVALKGDLPIGVSGESADVWQNPSLFNLDKTAGAPPDDFAENGQNWGFPTYNWEAMKAENFAWWKSRFANMARYFDAYRIDHILGFFRIWEIPAGFVGGVLGSFYPALSLPAEEIRASGIIWGLANGVKPFFTQEFLLQEFGKSCEKLKNDFLFREGFDKFVFKNEMENQLCALDFFKNNKKRYTTAEQQKILKLYENVLFVEDTRRVGHFHPRISPFKTAIYQALPTEEKAKFAQLHEEYFYRRNEEFWRFSALGKLPELTFSSSMLVCAEDLGMVPRCVPGVLENLEILSLEVERMPKVFGEEFVNPQNVPALSVFTTGTHDTSTLRGWWAEDEAKRQRYFTYNLHGSGKAPANLTSEIAQSILERAFNAKSLFVIVPLQDLLALDSSLLKNCSSNDRINNPADANWVWCYRMPVSIEELRGKRSLKQKIKNLTNRNS